ncbi:MAG: efflux RND transporter periplasmic adaptor subunit [Bryobacteraceae bacterium]
MRKALLLGSFAVLAVAAVWVTYARKTAPPEVAFTKVRRERLVSNLVTNGKVEPLEWVAVRAERSGLVEKVLVERGARVARGTPLIELSARDAEAELASAVSRVEQAKAEFDTMSQGGRAAERAEIDGELDKVRLELAAARANYDSLKRLAAKQAATGQEVKDAEEQVRRLESQARALETKRTALVAAEDRRAAAARLKEAEAAMRLARRTLQLSVVRAPIDGAVYELTVQRGAYLNPGDPVANIGRAEKVRVSVYVDEPELGRVAKGMPVSIGWDALPQQRWQGTVEKLPTEIVAVGTRQVGEVVCIIENPGLELLPGTNINAEVRSQVVENALTIPKEALRREGSQVGVLVLRGERVAWQPLVLGASSVTRTEVKSGLSDGDAVALPSEHALTNGSAVKPAFQ